MQRVKEDFVYTALFGVLIGAAIGAAIMFVLWALGKPYWTLAGGAVQLAVQAYVMLWTFSRIARERWQPPEPTRIIPAPNQQTRIQVIDDRDGYQQGLNLEPPIDELRLMMIAWQVYNGAPFSHSLAGAGRIISRSEYEALRDHLLSRGALAWRNPYSHKDGLEITRPGNAMVKYYASMVEDVPQLEG